MIQKVSIGIETLKMIKEFANNKKNQMIKKFQYDPKILI